MKPLCKNLKRIALFLSFAILMQSCHVYKYQASTLDEVIKAPKYKRVRVQTDLNQTYEFIKLYRENGRLYGLAKKQSETARKLKNQITEISPYNYVTVLLTEEQENQIKKTYLREIEKTDKVTPYILGGLLVGGLIFVAAKNTNFGISGADLFN